MEENVVTALCRRVRNRATSASTQPGGYKNTGHAYCYFLCHSLSVRDWCAHIRNALAAAQRPRIWQLGLGGGVDPFQFHGRPGARERDRRIIENSAMATATSLRLAGGARCSAWLHNRFWSSGAGRIVATCVANALELSAHASRTAVRCVFPDSTCADNGDGPDAAGVDRRSNVAANQFWARDWFSVWLEHFRRGGWCCAR